MSGWLADGAMTQPINGYMDHDMDGGTMSQAEMLETATADEATRPHLTGIIKHHQGASPWPKPSSPMARTPRPTSSPKHHHRSAGGDHHYEPVTHPPLIHGG